MQTTVALGYLPPSNQAIKEMADKVNLKAQAPDFIRDLCIIKAGGRYMTPEELDNQIKQSLLDDQPIIMTGDKKYPFRTSHDGKNHKNYASAYSSFLNESYALVQQVKNAIEAFPATLLGDSPLEHAVNLVQALANGAGVGNSPLSENELIPHILKPNHIQQLKNTINEAKNLTKSESDLLKTLSELKNKPESQQDENSDGAYGKMIADGTQTGPSAKKKALIENIKVLSDNRMKEILKVSRRMRSFSKLKVNKIQHFVPDAEGSEVRDRPMKNYGELGKIKPTQFTQMISMPHMFNYRAATNQYVVRERGKHVEKKQLLYVLVDCSGSMKEDDGSRINMAAGILINRLMAVAKGDAQVYWRFFDTVTYPAEYCETKSQANESIYKILNTEQYEGGGTNFDVAISSAIEHIKELRTANESLIKPEIFMVTDGDCECDFKKEGMDGIKLHAGIVSSGGSTSLKNLVGATGGAYIDFVADE